MALTAVNKADIRYFLGWSARFHQSDSRLEQAMSALETEPEAETLVLAAVDSCKDIDTKLLDAHNRLKALKVGSIDLPGQLEVETLRREGRRHVSRIAATLGVEVRHDVFGSTKYRGFAGHGGIYGRGNYELHG